MNERFRTFWNLLFQRRLTGKHQLLSEAVRVQSVKRYIEQKNMSPVEVEKDQDQLYEVAKTTESKLGYFPGDRELFHELFTTGKDFDLLDFAVHTYKNVHTGFLISPRYLAEYFRERVNRDETKTVLITEAEKFVDGLREMVQSYRGCSVTLLTRHLLTYEMLQLAFSGETSVRVVQASVYHRLGLAESFDLILAAPDFGGQAESGKDFIADTPTGTAVENLLGWVRPKGLLITVVPAGFAFSGGTVGELRGWISEHYGIEFFYTIPEGAFRPYSGMKTYLLGLKNGETKWTYIGNLQLEEQQLHLINEKSIEAKELQDSADWRIELFLSKNYDDLEKFTQSTVRKVKLKDVADVFRGKSVMKKDIRPGDVYVLNISNIEEGEVLTKNMDTIDEEKRKIKRYELIENDLVMTCRGTVNKTAVFWGTLETVIASANIIVIRFEQNIVSDYVKVFLESPVGQTIIRSFQRGTAMMNINPKDIAEMEIPVPDLQSQRQIANEYEEEFDRYKETVRQATDRWHERRDHLYQKVLDEGETINGRINERSQPGI